MTGSGTTGAVRATQIGSWPGTAVGSAQRIAFAETPDLPCLVELPDRSAGAGMIGRTASILADVPIDLQPAGWRISSGSARDQRVALSLLRSDLDVLEETAQGYVGAVKINFVGPWTLAATVEQTRGDKVLADHGARRDLAGALAEGITQLRSELGRRLPDLALRFQLDEPLLPQVTRGEVATASGFSRFRSVDVPEVVDALDTVITAAGDCWIHSCAADLPWDALLRTGAKGLSVDATLIGHTGWDTLGPALERGTEIALGVVATAGPVPSPEQLGTAVLRRWEALGLDDAALGRLWLTPTCGLAGRTETDAVASLRTLTRAADQVTDRVLG